MMLCHIKHGDGTISVWFLLRDAMQSAVMPQYVICLSVRPSVTFRYRDQVGILRK